MLVLSKASKTVPGMEQQFKPLPSLSLHFDISDFTARTSVNQLSHASCINMAGDVLLPTENRCSSAEGLRNQPMPSDLHFSMAHSQSHMDMEPDTNAGVSYTVQDPRAPATLSDLPMAHSQSHRDMELGTNAGVSYTVQDPRAPATLSDLDLPMAHSQSHRDMEPDTNAGVSYMVQDPRAPATLSDFPMAHSQSHRDMELGTNAGVSYTVQDPRAPTTLSDLDLPMAHSQSHRDMEPDTTAGVSYTVQDPRAPATLSDFPMAHSQSHRDMEPGTNAGVPYTVQDPRAPTTVLGLELPTQSYRNAELGTDTSVSYSKQDSRALSKLTGLTSGRGTVTIPPISLPEFIRGSEEVHIIFDSPGRLINTPKYFEQQRRDQGTKISLEHYCDDLQGNTRIQYRKWRENFLNCRECKRNLVRFIGKYFLNNAATYLQSHQTLYVAGCFDEEIADTAWFTSGSTRPQPHPVYTCNVEETDMRVWLHATKTPCNHVLIVSPDTDVYHIGLPLPCVTQKQVLVQVSAINSHQLKLLNLTTLVQALRNDPDLAHLDASILPQFFKPYMQLQAAITSLFSAKWVKPLFFGIFSRVHPLYPLEMNIPEH